jgi:hypothetical protein
MKIGYGINRQVLDFAKAPLDLDGFGSARVWVDTDKTVRPEFSEMLMGLRNGDIVFVVAMSDLGSGGFGQGEAVRKIMAHGATVDLVEAAAPAPAPRKPGPKPMWPTIPEADVQAVAHKWHSPDIYTWQAALAEAHKQGHSWVRRHHLNDNLGTRNAPKAKEPKA